eukprot:4753652-Pyramimonas_sp.AAC.1
MFCKTPKTGRTWVHAPDRSKCNTHLDDEKEAIARTGVFEWTATGGSLAALKNLREATPLLKDDDALAGLAYANRLDCKVGPCG